MTTHRSTQHDTPRPTGARENGATESERKTLCTQRDAARVDRCFSLCSRCSLLLHACALCALLSDLVHVCV